MTPTGGPDYVTTQEAAEMLGITQRWVQILARDGDLPSYRPARRVLLIERHRLEEYKHRREAGLSRGKIREGERRREERKPATAASAPASTTATPPSSDGSDATQASVGTLAVDLGRFG